MELMASLGGANDCRIGRQPFLYVRRTNMLRSLAALVALVATLPTAGCCTRHIMLKASDAQVGNDWTCSVIEGGDGTGPSAEKCVSKTSLLPAEQNQRGTVLVNLPSKCEGHFNQIVIHDAASSHPTVDVKCAPGGGSGPISETPKLPAKP